MLAQIVSVTIILHVDSSSQDSAVKGLASASNTCQSRLCEVGPTYRDIVHLCKLLSRAWLSARPNLAEPSHSATDPHGHSSTRGQKWVAQSQSCGSMAAMRREEYQELVQKIVDLYQARVVEYAKEMDSEKEKDLEAVARIWRLEHDGQAPPPLSVPRAAKSSTNGHQPTSQKQRIRKIIEGLSGSLDSAKVIRRYGEIYPDDAIPESSTVGKVFRKLIEEEKLECTEPAGFHKPAQFKKL